MNKIAMTAALVLCAALFAGSTFAQEDGRPGEEAVRNVMSAGQAPAYDMVPFYGEDLEIVLPPEQQSVLKFPWDVMPGNDLNELRKVDIVNIGDTLRFRPLMPLEETRWIFRDKNSQAIITATIRTDENVPPARLDFVDARPGNGVVPAPRASDPEAPGVEAKASEAPAGGYDISTINQISLQQVYAPERLRTTLPGSRKTRLDRSLTLRTLFIGQDVLVEPKEAWQASNGFYVTRLTLTNVDVREVELDAEWMRYTRLPRSTLFAATRLGSIHGASALPVQTSMIVVSETPWSAVTEGVL